MKILIADATQVASRALEEMLRNDGHHVLNVPTGEQAWNEFKSSEPPILAVLSQEMPDLSGLEICRRVRASEKTLCPHILLLSQSSHRQDALAAFEAGADDFMARPFEPELLRARTRAGLRRAQFEYRLISALQTHHTGGQNDTAPGAATAAQTGAPSGESPLNALCTPEDIEQLVTQTLADMGLGDAAVIRDPAALTAFNPEISIMHFIIVPDKSIWLDLVLETDKASAVSLYQTFTGITDETVPESDLIDSLGETLNMVHGALKLAFRGKDFEVIVPVTPQPIPSARLRGQIQDQAVQSRALYEFAGSRLRFTVIAYSSPVQRKPLKDLHVANVLAEPLCPVGNANLVLINKGTMLNRRSLSKVSNMTEFAPQNLTHPVIEPSPLAALLPE